MRRRISGDAILVLGLMLLGCVGAIEDMDPYPVARSPIGSGGSGPSTGNAPGPGSGPSTGNAPGPGSAAPGGLGWPVEYHGTASALRRLSRDEIVATMELLTGMAPARNDLPDEPRQGHGVLRTSGLSFIATEIADLKVVLTQFAAKAAPGALAKSGCAFQEQAQRDCLLAWALRFAEQGFRRPPRSGESARFQKIIESAGVSSRTDLDATEGVLITVFFSPSFLYRTEVGTAVPGQPGLRALTAQEVATRLSYLASLAPPDAELWSAASSGRLKDAGERTKQFDRLSRTEMGKRALALFVLESLGATESKVAQKSDKYVTGLGADFEISVRASAVAAIRSVLDGPDPTVGSLLSTTAYQTDPAVQKVMLPAGAGRTASGDGDTTTRVGLMMHPHVLASHTKEDGSSPFQIGVFMRKRFLCEAIPPPPANAVASARINPPPGLSMREDLEYRTGVTVQG